jgi:hypothetical protein
MLSTRFALLCFSSLILSLCFTGLSSADVDLSTAVGIWLFDDGSGDVAADTSGQGNDGKLVNSPGWVAGKFGTALEFNGTDNCVQTEKKLLDGLEAFTIVAWVKPGNITATRVGLVGQNDSPEFGFIDPGNVNLWTPTAGGLNNPYTHPPDEWHHVAAVASTTFTKVYIDGEATETAGDWPNHGSSEFGVNIGGCGVWDGEGNWFTGAMDEVAIFHQALSDEDIQTVMEGLSSGATSVEAAGKLATKWADIKTAN